MNIKETNEEINGDFPGAKLSASVDYGVANWDDETCLQQYLKFLSRVEMSNVLTPDDDGIIRSQILFIKCGDQVLASSPQGLKWPLQMVEGPEEGEAVN